MHNEVDYKLFTGLPPEPLLTSLLELYRCVFNGGAAEDLIHELVYHNQRGPFLINLALLNEQVIGCKIGYERKPGHFYSWLGCVDAPYRGQGVAVELMRRQHDWCVQQDYRTIRTHTYNQWRGMLLLNIKYGFDIVGTQQGKHGLLIVLEKQLIAD